MNALARIEPAHAASSDFASFLATGLRRSGCIASRARAYQWLIPRTRDTAQLFTILDTLFPNG